MGAAKTLSGALHSVQGAAADRRATFDVVRNGDLFALVAGSHQAIQTLHGAVVTVPMTWAQLQELRTLCNELLSGGGED